MVTRCEENRLKLGGRAVDGHRVIRRANRRAAPLLVCAAAGALLCAAPAHAEPAPATAAQARAQAQAAEQAVREVGEHLERTGVALQRQQQALAQAVSTSIGAQVDADRTAAAASGARARSTQRVRSIYMDAGSGLGRSHALALLRSVSTGTDPALAVRGFDAARRGDADAQAGAQALAAGAAAASRAADDAATGAVSGLREVTGQLALLQDALTAARQRVGALDAQAAQLQAAEDAAAALAAAQAQAAQLAAAAERTATASTASVHARSVPADYASLYPRAAATCTGMRTSLLAAVGQVESGHGVNVGPSSAGAQGPMQFMPATFAAYAVDGDGDGERSAWDPEDAVFTAAAYLCANGAGAGREGEAGALFRYNHADWYVAMVQRVADEMDAAAGSPAP